MEFKHEKGRVYMENDSLRGQGMADKLVRAALADIAKDGKKYRATCSYAVKWLEKHK